MNILITGACGVTSRAIARSLRVSSLASDLRIVGTDVCDNPYGLFEGLYDSVYRIPHVREASYAQCIVDICAREKIDAGIVIPELEVVYWSGRRFPARVALPPPKLCQIAVSKKRLYEVLANTGLVPGFSVVSRETVLGGNICAVPRFPVWVRDFGEGGTSGKGSLLAQTPDEFRAWAILNPAIDQFMVSEYLPGRNFACHLLYSGGRVVKIACYERIEYFMARTVMSGISGNISKGRLLNDGRLSDISMSAIERILLQTGEQMHGIVAIDLREAADGSPMITEINLRHVAATYSFAAAGFNLAEAHLLITLGKVDAIGPLEMAFPHQNMILRDIDGAPMWIANYRIPGVGEAIVGRDNSPGSVGYSLEGRRS